MSKITQTKLSRAVWRNSFLKRLDKDGKKIPTQLIVGFKEPQKREWVHHPKIKGLSAFASAGQRLNWGLLS